MTTEIEQPMAAIIASDTHGPVLLPGTIVAGADLVTGTILGRITTGGKLKAYASGSSDGSQIPIGVLMEDAAAASADVENVTIGFAGVYVEDNMTGLDAAAKLGLEPKGVYFAAKG